MTMRNSIRNRFLGVAIIGTAAVLGNSTVDAQQVYHEDYGARCSRCVDGTCLPQRNFGYTPTRWHRWPDSSQAARSPQHPAGVPTRAQAPTYVSPDAATEATLSPTGATPHRPTELPRGPAVPAPQAAPLQDAPPQTPAPSASYVPNTPQPVTELAPPASEFPPSTPIPGPDLSRNNPPQAVLTPSPAIPTPQVIAAPQPPAELHLTPAPQPNAAMNLPFQAPQSPQTPTQTLQEPAVPEIQLQGSLERAPASPAPALFGNPAQYELAVQPLEPLQSESLPQSNETSGISSFFDASRPSDATAPATAEPGRVAPVGFHTIEATSRDNPLR